MTSSILLSLLVLAVAFVSTNSQHNEYLLDTDIVLGGDDPYPYSYCVDNFILSVDSLYMNGQPAKGKNSVLDTVTLHPAKR